MAPAIMAPPNPRTPSLTFSGLFRFALLGTRLLLGLMGLWRRCEHLLKRGFAALLSFFCAIFVFRCHRGSPMPDPKVIALVGAFPKPPSAEELEKLYRPYSEALGNVLFAWNHLQEGLLWLFGSLTRPENEHIMRAAWHATESDATQRKMLREAYKAALRATEYTQQREDIKWLLKEAQELSGTRNDAIHAPLTFTTTFTMEGGSTRLEPKTSGGHPKAVNLDGYDLIELFDWTRKVCNLLRAYAYDAGMHFRTKGLLDRPWPERPQLPPRPLKNPAAG